MSLICLEVDISQFVHIQPSVLAQFYTSETRIIMNMNQKILANQRSDTTSPLGLHFAHSGQTRCTLET